jgi:hypothetical protein
VKHFVIYIPGLGDRKTYAWAQKLALNLWRTSHVIPCYFVVGWADEHETYKQKRERLIKTIDAAANNGYTVSLVAASAGSNLALAGLAARPYNVHRVVSICGKINHVETVKDAFFILNPAFKDAMLASKKYIPSLTAAARRKILIVRATRDSFVPARDGEVEGAHTHILHSVGHVFSIFMAITVFRHITLRFIKGKA